jgi:hypothetical protein
MIGQCSFLARHSGLEVVLDILPFQEFTAHVTFETTYLGIMNLSSTVLVPLLFDPHRMTPFRCTSKVAPGSPSQPISYLLPFNPGSYSWRKESGC